MLFLIFCFWSWEYLHWNWVRITSKLNVSHHNSPISTSLKLSICEGQLSVASIEMPYFSKLISVLYPEKYPCANCSLYRSECDQSSSSGLPHQWLFSSPSSSSPSHFSTCCQCWHRHFTHDYETFPWSTSTITKEVSFPPESLWDWKLVYTSLCLLELCRELSLF